MNEAARRVAELRRDLLSGVAELRGLLMQAAEHERDDHPTAIERDTAVVPEGDVLKELFGDQTTKPSAASSATASDNEPSIVSLTTPSLYDVSYTYTHSGGTVHKIKFTVEGRRTAYAVYRTLTQSRVAHDVTVRMRKRTKGGR